MNILIIGNGFDLAHELETSYSNILDFFEIVQSSFIKRNDVLEFCKFKLNNYKVSQFLKEYIKAVFASTEIEEGQIKNSNPLIQEIYEKLTDNIWYTYLNELYKKKKMRGNNWIDFESEISGIIEQIDREQENLDMPFDINKIREDEKVKIFMSRLQSIINSKAEINISTYDDFLKKSYSDLNRLIRCIEIYLIECIDKQEIHLFSQDIIQCNAEAVLCFNYTHTYERVYAKRKNVTIHYLHGETNSRDKSFNNIVLGIDEYYKGKDKDRHTNYNIYKKFTQRIIKETGFQYRDWIAKMNSASKDWRSLSENKKYEHELPNNVYIFGHSLDITDKDVIKDFIDRDDVKTTVFYHDKQQQTQQIANLVKLLGQKKFISMINKVPQRICFVSQDEMKKYCK